jgi:hypothetical protein
MWGLGVSDTEMANNISQYVLVYALTNALTTGDDH